MEGFGSGPLNRLASVIRAICGFYCGTSSTRRFLALPSKEQSRNQDKPEDMTAVHVKAARPHLHFPLLLFDQIEVSDIEHIRDRGMLKEPFASPSPGHCHREFHDHPVGCEAENRALA